MLAKFLSRFYHACWYIAAAVIITAAVCVTVIRLMLPQINDYKPQVETWISDRTDYNIELEHIDAHWEGWTPTLLLHGIRVTDKSSTRILTTLDSASVTVNPYFSLRQQDLTQLQITLVGPGVQITRELDGSIMFANINTGRDQQIHTGHEFFADWVLQQRSIAIEDASIIYVDRNNPDAGLTLSDVNLILRNSHTRTQIQATAGFPAEYGDTLKISVDAFGDITTPDWNGRIYFEGNRIYPARFPGTGEITSQLESLENTPATIHFWSDWKKGRLTKLDGEVVATDIQFPSATTHNTISSLAAAFSIDRSDPGFRSRISIRDLQSSHGSWQPATIDIYREEYSGSDRYRYIIESDYLKIEDILPALQLVDPDLFDGKDIRGILADNRMIYDSRSDQQLYFHGDIQSLAISDEKTNAAISASGGTVNGTPQWGQMQFHSASLELSLPDTFTRNINFYEFNGDFNWTWSGEELLIETDHFETHTPHFETAGKIRLVINPEQTPFVDLRLRNTNINLEQLVQYMPAAIYDDVRDWMTTALVSGEIISTDTLLRGYLHDFPYENSEGRFQVAASIKNAVLDYHPDWIPAENIDAQFLMDNNRIEVTGGRGTIYDAQIDELTAVIPDVAADRAELLIEGKVSGTTTDARNIIDNSLLSKSATLSGIKQHDINGDLKLDLALDIPLYKGEMDYRGRLHLTETRMQSPALGITLEDIKGHINFSRDQVASESLQAVYSGQPVTLDIRTGGGSHLLLGLEGHSDSRFITSQLVRFFPNLASAADKLQNSLDGATRWSATLAPAEEDTTGIPGDNAMLTIRSDLSGLNILLPEPFGKGEEPAPLMVSTTISGSSGKNIRIEYNNELLAGISISQNGVTRLERVEIALGSDTRLFDSGNGVFIHGSTERLSLSDWQEFIQSLELRKSDDDQRNIQVDLQVASLEYLNQKFANTDFRINNLQPELYITLNGSGINGKIILPDNLQNSTVKATFSTLHLQESDSDNGMDIIDPRATPALEMTVNDFSYGNFQLGGMNLATSKLPEGLAIDSLGFTRPGMTINGSGNWVMKNDVPVSDFRFRLRAGKLETMLSTFDYSVAAINDGKTKLNLEANWEGSPMDFSLAETNGTLEMDIEKGRFLDIEPAAGRLFGLLSLQTLPRRLALDFTDLFGKGFSFDQIEGTFTIESGNAYTNNLSMTGPSAYIQVNGRTGLIDKDYDQIVTVTPQFSDSLPVASALFGPIGVGVGAVLFLAGELFESIPRQIDKLLRYQYSVKGSWDDPVIEKIQATTGSTVDSNNSKAVIGK